MNASYARIRKSKTGKRNLTIKRENTTITGIVPSPEAIAEIGAGVWMGDTVRRSGAIETVAICFRYGKKTERKVLSAVDNCGGNIVLSDNAIAGSDGLIVVPIKSGDCDKLDNELSRSEYLQPMDDKPPRAWLTTGIIPRESTGSTGHETPVVAELDEYRKDSDNRKDKPPREFHTATSEVSPKRIDYTAARNAPKASYNCDGQYTINELDHADARNQPFGAKPSDTPVKVSRLRTPDLADTEH